MSRQNLRQRHGLDSAKSVGSPAKSRPSTRGWMVAVVVVLLIAVGGIAGALA